MRFLVLCLLLACSANSLIAFELDSEFNVTGRYRRDEIDLSEKIKLAPPTLTETDKVHAKDLDVWQWGIDYRFMMPTLFCGTFSFLNNFYLDGYAYWGYGGKNGKLSEKIHAVNPVAITIGKAHLKNAQNSDFQVGIGYLFSWNCWGLGISGGYSYDKFKLKTSHGKTSIGGNPFEDAILYAKGYKTTTIWEGGYVGAKLFYEWCSWLFDIGYEFHLPRYSEVHALSDRAEVVQSRLPSKSRSNQAYGNVAFLDVHYYICGGLVLGAGFKYQNWTACHARVRPRHGSFVDHHLPATTKINENVEWNSYSASVDIGYYF